MMRVTINGGHYPGVDSGAVGASGLQEADVVCDMMQRTAAYLRDAGYEVLEVQEKQLYEITDASNNFEAELFVSIHCNAAVNTAATGTETYCYNFGTEGEQLARCIQKQIVSRIGTADRGVKKNNYYVLRNTNCPAVLVETAFITNLCDESLLADGEMRDQFAAAIAQGVCDYLGL